MVRHEYEIKKILVIIKPELKSRVGKKREEETETKGSSRSLTQE